MSRGIRDGSPPPAPEPLPASVVGVADAHCHLDLIDMPVEEALKLARSVGVTRIVTIGVDVETSRWCAATAAEHPDVYAAVALHPNEAPALASEEAYAEIARLAALPQVRAVGETGLDFFRTSDEGRPAQEASFRRHIRIAKETGTALVIHDRDAHTDVLRVLDDEGAPERTVIHAFSGDESFARACAERGLVMSFAGNVTFKNAPALRSAAAVAPRDLILVETDAPFLTPMPYRGRPNGSYLIPLTLRALAEVRRDTVEELGIAVAATADRVFGPWR